MSRHFEAYQSASGAGDARPTAMDVVQNEGLVGKLTDKVFVVTGVSSGIGIETMRALYATGGHVFGTARNMEKAQQVVDKVKSETGGGSITLISMEQDKLASIKTAAETILRATSIINILICNAGVMATPGGKTDDGFETQFGTNHLGHFYLFQLLKPALLASATPAFPSRVVVLTSFSHRISPIRFDDYNFSQPDSYNPWVAYGQSKTANIYFANMIERLYGDKNLHSTSCHPGVIWTGLQKHANLDPNDDSFMTPELKNNMKNVGQGAATSVYAALGEEWKSKGGRYLSDCVEQKAFQHHGEDPNFIGDDGYESWAYDEESERKLWKDSMKMVGLHDDM